MKSIFRGAAVALLCPVLLLAQEATHKVQTAERTLPKELSEAIRKQLSPQAVVVTDAKGTEVAEVWHRKQIPATASDAQLKTGLNYRNIKESEVIGAVRFKQNSADYRKQTIKPGVYTMRLGYQPLDGDHAGSSMFTEFILLLKADEDTAAELLGQDTLYEKSMSAAGTTHPAVFMLFPNPKPADAPQIVDKGGHHQVLLSKQTVSLGAGKTAPIGFGVTVVGSAGE